MPGTTIGLRHASTGSSMEQSDHEPNKPIRITISERHRPSFAFNNAQLAVVRRLLTLLTARQRMFEAREDRGIMNSSRHVLGLVGNDSQSYVHNWTKVHNIL